MTQIFTNEGLGLSGSSIGQLGAYGPKGGAALGQGGESVYINAANGNMVLRQSDGFLAGSGLGLELIQSYNSQGERGQNWCFNTQTHLIINGPVNCPGSELTRVDEDGHSSRFIFDNLKGYYVSENGGTASLRFTNNSWSYREGASNSSCEYNEKGQLTRLTDRDGHLLQFHYRDGQLERIVDSSGKQTIEWTFEKGLLRDILTLSEGKTIHHLHYDYDENQRLQKVSRDLGEGKTYWITYDYAGDSNRITAIRQSDGSVLYIDYDSEGRVKALKDGEGRITTYKYYPGKTEVRDNSGQTLTYFYDEKGRLTGIDSPSNKPIRYEYKGDYLAAIHQGSLHWFFSYNETGDCIRMEDSSGQVKTRTYDNEHRLLNETLFKVFDGSNHPQNSKISRFVYDQRGHLRFKIAADGTVTEYRYNQEGQCLSTRTYLRAGYNLSQLAQDQVLGLDDLINWVSLQNPQAISLKNYHYDWRGLLDEELLFSNINAQGEGLRNKSLLTRYRYDAAGRLVEKMVPTKNGYSTTTYLYDDLGRLIQRCDNQNHYERFEYDDSHQRIISTDAKGLQTIRTFDRSGLLLSTQYVDKKQQNYGTTRYSYDAAGRLQSELSADGKATYYFYDKEGQLVAKCKPGGALTEYRYDAVGQLVQTLEYKETVDTKNWLKSIPAWSDLHPSSSSKDRISQLVYNACNQVAYQIDAGGAVIAFDYDVEGRVIKKTAYAKRLSNYQADQLLSFDSITLAATKDDRSNYYFYDPAGRLQAEINGEGSAKSYHYDRQGHLLETIRHARHLSLPPPRGWVAPKAANADIHNFSLYNLAGLKIADIDAEGYVSTYEYDERGLLIKQRRLSQAISETIFSEINAETTLAELQLLERESDHLSNYIYDDLGQLIEQREQNGLIRRYSYDEKGLLLEKTLIDGKTQKVRQERFRFDVMGRISQSLDALGAAKLAQNESLGEDEIEAIWQQHGLRYNYDLAGQLISRTNSLNQTIRYFYNEAGQLVYTVNANGEVSEQGYNIFNQIEFSYRYSKVLKGNLADLTTSELASRLSALKNEAADEFTHYEYNNLGLLIKKLTGKKGQLLTSYNSFGEIEETQESLSAAKQLVKRYSYDRRGLLCHQLEDVGGLNRSTETGYDIFGRIENTIDARKGLSRYFYDGRGNLSMIINQAQKRKSFYYDAFNRILSETNYGPIAINRYTYDDQNNTLTLEHPGIYCKIKTQFNAFGDTIEVIDGNGKSTHYSYDAKGQLSDVKGPEGSSKDYQYDANGNLVLQQEAGGRLISYSYDAEGRILSKIIDPDGLALTTTYHYDGLGRQLEIIEANGVHKQFNYDDRGNLNQSCIDPAGLNLIANYYYDDRNNLVRQIETNSRGKNKITAYEWDNLGRRTALIIDPDGLKLTTRYSYDLNNNLISQTDAKNQTSYFIYDVKNLCRYQINARGVVTEHRYNDNGNEMETLVYANRIASPGFYSEKDLANLIIPSPGDHSLFRDFDLRGRLISFFDALGNATTYYYDANDNLLHITGYSQAKSLAELKAGDRGLPNAKEQRHQYFAYDGMNQLVYQLDEGNYLTQFDYDSSGQLRAKTRFAVGLTLNSTRYSLEDIRNNIQASPGRDQYMAYAYDQAGRLSHQASADGSVISYSYDGLGNIIASQKYATRLNSASLRSNNWQAELIANNHDRMTRFIFDAAGREIYRISAEGRVLERRYDDLGNVVAGIAHGMQVAPVISSEQELRQLLRIDSNARETDYDYDSAGRLALKTDSKHQKTSYIYDENNSVLSKIEANSAQWIYVYDEENQLIETHSPITSLRSYEGGWVTKTRSIVTRNIYDSFGNIISTIRDAEGAQQTQNFVYDANNRKLQTIYSKVLINSATNQASASRQEQLQTLTEELKYNAFGELIASKDRANNWRYKAYDKKGQLLYSVDAQSALTSYRYDAFGNVQSKTTHAKCLSTGPNFDYSVEAITNALSTANNDRTETYSYDLNNRLIETRRPLVYSYNARTKHYEALNPVSSMAYNAFGELSSIAVKRNETDWSMTSYYYDKDGLKTARLDAEHYLTTYRYNHFGELVAEIDYADRATIWDEETITPPKTNSKDRHIVFSYDLLGRLTAKTLKNVSYEHLLNGSNRYERRTGDLTSSYSYDAMGNLTSTTDPLGYSAYYYYDALNHLIAKVGPPTATGRAATSYSYDSLGQLVETIRYAQGAKEADENHYLLKGESANDIINRSIYDNQGRVVTAINGLNHEINYSYDANGQVQRSWQILSQVDSSKRLIDKRYSYDKEGHLLQTATYKNNGQIKTDDASYNAFGELIAKGIDGNLSTHVEYDNLGRVRRSNTQGHYQIYVYDLTDKVTQTVTSTNAYSPEYGYEGVDLSEARFDNTETFHEAQWRYNLQRQDNEYDGLGHCLRQSKEFTISAGKSELSLVSQSQTLDRWGNILSHISARGFETHYEYNAFNQVIKQELPEVNILDEQFLQRTIKPTLYYAYDALGRAIAITDANGHTMAKILDANGSTLEEIDALGHKRIKTYDLFGRLHTSQNERGGLTTYTYDKANNLTTLITPTSSQSYFYDEAGQLIKQDNALGQSLFFWYDNLDNLVQKSDSKGRLTTYDYDDAGHKTKETDANKLSQSWRYDEQGRLVEHSDLGGHSTAYHYNKNGLLVEETSSAGKNISYRYLGDGQLYSYSDNTYKEVTYYGYDADGNMINKSASRATQGNDNGWILETDVYAYDAQGRLTAMRRRHPDDQDHRFPGKDNALLSIDYSYDAVGNICKTHVEANYTGYQKLINDDYYSYDANNRMVINKGSLMNGQLIITNSQGSMLVYDEAGNVKEAYKFENGGLQDYHYSYDNNSRLQEIYKNGHILKTIHYDVRDRIDKETVYDSFGHASEQIDMIYDGDALQWQISKTAFLGDWYETEKNVYQYDNVGNLVDLTSWQTKSNMKIQSSHHYNYEYWDGYLQSTDSAFLTINGSAPTFGQNTRFYDANGQLVLAIDLKADGSGNSNTTQYKISTFDGIHSRIDKNGQTNYLTVAGKTIGDMQLNKDGSQRLNVYGGFTPVGKLQGQDSQSFFSRANEEQAARSKAESIVANSPQDNTGTYTVCAGDSLENIALQAYGDSSLWYLIADANGITDRHATNQLHNGQRLIIPAVATKQHQNTGTHQLMNSTEILGDLSATLAIPDSLTTASPAPGKHNSLFKKIAIAAISVVATVIAAAVFATLGGALGATLSGGLGQILSLGMKVLSGQVMGTLGSLTAGFTAGVAGNLTGQGLANAFGLQKGIDLRSALITGLSTAASTGVLQELNSSQAFKNVMQKLDNFSSSSFSLASAAQMMEQDAISQGLSLALQNHQHFNWYELGSKAALAGLSGSKYGKDFNDSLTDNLGEGPGTLIQSELSALATNGMQSAINSGHFDAISVLKDNLGSAIGTGFLNTQAAAEEKRIIAELNTESAALEGPYCPIPKEENFSSIPEGSYERFHQERAERKLYNSIKEKANELWNDYGDKVISYGPKALGIWLSGAPEDEADNSLSAVLGTGMKAQLYKAYKDGIKEAAKVMGLETRIDGSLQAAGGIIEMAAAGPLLATPPTAPLGYLLSLHGIDHMLTGALKATTGQSQNTATYDLLRKASFSEKNTAIADLSLSIIGTPMIAARKSLLKVTNYTEKLYYTKKEQTAIKATYLMENLKSPEFKNTISNGALGAFSGAYGAFAAGGDAYDVLAGAMIGAGVSMAARYKEIIKNPYASAGFSNFMGQSFSQLRNPQNTQYSLISFAFSLTGAGMANFVTHAIDGPIIKMMVDTMYTGTFNAVGSNLGKQKGW
jgi:YD repeat-containing protein